jgi:hypothetical protein
MGASERVDTVAVLSVLIAYNSLQQSERFHPLELFVQTVFSLPGVPNRAASPKWREVSPAGLDALFRPTEAWTQRR